MGMILEVATSSSSSSSYMVWRVRFKGGSLLKGNDFLRKTCSSSKIASTSILGGGGPLKLLKEDRLPKGDRLSKRDRPPKGDGFLKEDRLWKWQGLWKEDGLQKKDGTRKVDWLRKGDGLPEGTACSSPSSCSSWRCSGLGLSSWGCQKLSSVLQCSSLAGIWSKGVSSLYRPVSKERKRQWAPPAHLVKGIRNISFYARCLCKNNKKQIFLKTNQKGPAKPSQNPMQSIFCSENTWPLPVQCYQLSYIYWAFRPL